MISIQNKDKYFCVFASCFPVKGAKRSIIMDVQREVYIYIPNSLYDFLPTFRIYKIAEILHKHNEEAETIEEYIDYMVSHEIGFFTDSLSNFPSINTEFLHPLEILDAIVEVSIKNMSHLEQIFFDLSSLGCQQLELRSFESLSFHQLNYITKLAEKTRLRNIMIITKYDDRISKNELNKFVRNNLIINRLVIHSAPKGEDILAERILFTERPIKNSEVCGCNIKDFFTVNLMFALESMHFNNCLHRKVSIDKDGNILNCLNIKNTILGNIATHSLPEVIRNPKFQKFWNVNKDKIKVCKDCEYRYMCSDCRAHIDHPYEKPKYCNYDPYTNTYDSEH